MIFKAYLDEANTSVREPDMTVAGFLGTARQWRVVERELRVIKRRLGFQSFHGVEFKGRRGNFAGWSNAQSMQLVNALARLVREELTEAIEFTCRGTSMPRTTGRRRSTRACPDTASTASAFSYCWSISCIRGIRPTTGTARVHRSWHQHTDAQTGRSGRHEYQPPCRDLCKHQEPIHVVARKWDGRIQHKAAAGKMRGR